MAAAVYSISRVEKFLDDAHVITWTLTDSDNYGQALEMPGSADRTIQLTGTFGGGTVVMQGSNLLSPTEGTDTDWFNLTDPQGTAISKTTAGGESILELTRWIRPKITGSTGAALVASLLVKRK